jgi:hypothetical protein
MVNQALAEGRLQTIITVPGLKLMQVMCPRAAVSQ